MGVTFKGISCSQVGLEVMDIERPLFGAFSDSFVKLPKQSGSVVIGDSSEEDIEIRVQFLLEPNDGQSYYDACRELRVYFKSDDKEKLIFTEDPDWAYMAKFVSSDNIERIADDGLFWTTFRCSPDMVPI